MQRVINSWIDLDKGKRNAIRSRVVHSWKELDEETVAINAEGKFKSKLHVGEFEYNCSART